MLILARFECATNTFRFVRTSYGTYRVQRRIAGMKHYVDEELSDGTRESIDHSVALLAFRHRVESELNYVSAVEYDRCTPTGETFS